VQTGIIFKSCYGSDCVVFLYFVEWKKCCALYLVCLVCWHLQLRNSVSFCPMTTQRKECGLSQLGLSNITSLEMEYVYIFTVLLLPRYLSMYKGRFSAWPSSVQIYIKIVFASYSSKAQNTTCTIWLLGYKYFVHFSGRQLLAEVEWLIQCYLRVCQDLLEYRKKHRVLRVRMLDGSVKTLMVDDSHTVTQLMITVCSKIGLCTGLLNRI